MTQNEKTPGTICFNGKQYQLNHVLEEGTLLPTPDFEEVDSAALVGNELWVLQDPIFIMKWVLVGHIEPILVGKGKPAPKHPRYIKLAGTQQWVENPRYESTRVMGPDLDEYLLKLAFENPNTNDETPTPVEYQIVGRILETSQGHEILTTSGWVTVGDKYLGVWPTEEDLPEDDTIQLGSDLLWRGALYNKDKEGWYIRRGSKVPDGVLTTKANSMGDNSITILGELWERAKSAGFTGSFEDWAAAHSLSRSSLLPSGALPEEMGAKIPDEVATNDNSNSWAEVSSYDKLNVLGSFPLNMPLPDPSAFKPGDSLFWRKHMWVCDNNKQWAQLALGMPEGGLLPFTSWDFEAYQAAARDNDFEHQLDLAMDDDWNDKGSMARVLLETRKENKRLKRNRFIAGVLWRLLFLGILLGAGYGAYQYIFASIQTGRYVDERSCKVSKGGLTITGKRTFSYPYKSLFGYRLLDETQVIVKTIVDIKGDRLTVTGFNGQKYWQSRVNMGEKGILILKDADTYMFQTDKDLIVATSGGFCNPVQRELSETELKQPELDIIK